MRKPLSAPATPWRQPTEQQILLLHAALLEGEAARAAWREWRVTADLDQLPPGGFGLLPLLAYSLQKQGISDSLLDKCQGIYRRTWTQNQLYLRQTAALLQRVQGTEITPLWQGDLVLALAYYPTAGIRMIQRVQLITAAPQATTVQAQLAQTQWRAVQTPKDHLRAFIVGGQQPQRFRQPDSDLVLEWQQAAPSPLALLWQQRQPLTINGLPTHSVSATDLLFTLCSQGMADFWRFGLIQWAADAFWLLQSAAPLVDWAELCKQAQQQGCTVRLSAALHGLQQWLDIIPAAVLTRLAQQPVQPFEEWEAQWLHRLPPQLSKGGVLWAAAQRRRWAQRH